MNARRIVLVLLVSLPLPALAETAQDFSGEWVLADRQPAASAATGAAADNPRSGGHGHGRGGGMGGMGGHGGAMGGGGRHHRNGVPANSAAGDAPDGVPRLHAQALTIRQSEVVFDVATADGQRSVYRFDNRNNYGPAYGGTVTLTWAAPEMIIETHPDAGGSIEEHYRLSDDGKQLTLEIHAQRAGADAARDVTRVFVRGGQDRAPSTMP